MRPASRTANSLDSIPVPAVALANLVRFSAHHSPYYREQFWARRLRDGQAVTLADIPVTDQASVRGNAGAFLADGVPPEDGMICEEFTAGRTAAPLRILKTQRQCAIGKSEAVRLRRGWGCERHGRAVMSVAPDDPRQAGMVQETMSPGGGRMWRIFSIDAGEVAALLKETRATLLVARPSTVAALFRDHPEIDFLQLVSTAGEGVDDAAWKSLGSLPGVSHFDAYATAEIGPIAATCKCCGCYHPADRHVVVEVVDGEDRPVGPGETGRVIVTPLFGLAMPLLRYDIGDRAVRSASGKSDCPALSLDRIIQGVPGQPRRARPFPFWRVEEILENDRRRREESCTPCRTADPVTDPAPRSRPPA